MARISRVQDDFDGAWKNMLSERRFASFVAFFMPEVYGLIAWSRPVEFLEQELLEEGKEMPHLTTSERIGRKIGREEGRRELLLDQLAVKFGPLSAEIIARVNTLETAEIDRLGRAILTAQTLQDLGL